MDENAQASHVGGHENIAGIPRGSLVDEQLGRCLERGRAHASLDDAALGVMSLLLGFLLTAYARLTRGTECQPPSSSKLSKAAL